MDKTKIINGKTQATSLCEKIQKETVRLKSEHNIVPGLAVVVVGKDPASQVYVKKKAEQTLQLGMHSIEHKLEESTSEAALITLIEKLNTDEAVNGILVQLPLPQHINSKRILSVIKPEKDVDGFHITNVGRLWTNSNALVPCTPFGCLMLLKSELNRLAGLHAIILGRSNIVGKPLAALLLAEDCTVTIAHSKTTNLESLCRSADILIAAVGRPKMVEASWIKPGATVIDVGINRIDAPEIGEGKTRLVGDVDFEAGMQIASKITPVPGGVGPMTIACLLRNTLVATFNQASLSVPDI